MKCTRAVPRDSRESSASARRHPLVGNRTHPMANSPLALEKGANPNPRAVLQIEVPCKIERDLSLKKGARPASRLPL
eukprot:9474374-Pyramimonas_sp.AAC.1